MVADQGMLMRLMPRLVVFECVASAGGFSAAGRRLGVGKGVVSHHIRLLEQELGVQLLVRSTRAVSLTPAGDRLYQRAKAMIGDIQSTAIDVRRDTREVTGVLRVVADADLMSDPIAEAIAEYSMRYPDARIEVRVASEEAVASGAADMAIRFGRPSDSSLIVRRLVRAENALCASAKYLASLAPTTDPRRLEKARWLGHVDDGRSGPIRVECPDGEVIELEPVISPAADTRSMLIRLACAGAGLTVVPRFLAERELASGALVHVLPNHTVVPGEVVALFCSRERIPARARAFVDLLAATLPSRVERSPRRPGAASAAVQEVGAIA